MIFSNSERGALRNWLRKSSFIVSLPFGAQCLKGSMQHDPDVRFSQPGETCNGAVGEAGAILESHQLPVTVCKLGEEDGQLCEIGVLLYQILCQFTSGEIENLIQWNFPIIFSIMILGNPPGDREEPRRESRQVVPVTFSIAPGFLESPGCQIFREGPIGDMITKIIVDSGELGPIQICKIWLVFSFAEPSQQV